jgi:hypothetical protein
MKSYRENVQRALSHKNAYSHNKAILENTKLYNTKLEDNIKRYMAIVNWFMISLAAPIPATYSCPGSPVSHALFRNTRVTKLPDPTLFAGDRIVFDD